MRIVRVKMKYKEVCHAEPVEARGQRPLRATLRQAANDTLLNSLILN